MIDYSNAKLYSVSEDAGKKVVLRKEGKHWFGPFPVSHFYDIENSEDVVRDKKAQRRMKSVEFVFASNKKMGDRKTNCLTFVEIKSSLPALGSPKKETLQRLKSNPSKKEFPKVATQKLTSFVDLLSDKFDLLPKELQEKFSCAFSDSWIISESVKKICDKFLNSWRLLLSVVHNREESNDIPDEIIARVQNPQTTLLFIWALDIENDVIRCVKSKNKNMELSEEEIRRCAQNMIREVLEVAQHYLELRLNDRLWIERKICQTQIYVVTIEQARMMRLLPSNPT